jgi:hypothetical protein
MYDFYDFVAFIGGIIRTLGLLVFGIAAGWFTLDAFHQPERKWQLQVAVFLGFFFFSALVIRFASPAGTGMFVLGAGGALLYWGMKKEQVDEELEDDV